MGMMIVRHKVRDYGQWGPIFDGHAEMQSAAGLINPRVYHSADSNKSEIVVVFDTEDIKEIEISAGNGITLIAWHAPARDDKPSRCEPCRISSAAARHG